MGLWKALERQNVAMMKTHPSRENTEQTRSITLIALRCASELILPVWAGLEEAGKDNAEQKQNLKNV